MKKLLITTLLIPVVALADVEKIGDIEWHYKIKDGNACITSTKVSGSFTIPNNLGGCPVTEIETAVFCGCSLGTVTIPTSMKTIGNIAFWCTDFEAFNVDKSNAYYCSIDGVLYDKSKTTLIRCPVSKKNIKIPSSVTAIKGGAFHECKLLTTITIPVNVQTIGGSVACGDSLLSFYVDKNNAFYSAVDGVLYDKNQKELMQCPRGKRGDVKMPSSVSKIRQGAFCGCKLLTSIEMSPSVTEIPDGAFQSCDLLKTVTMPRYVEKIGKRAFALCESLTSITIPSSVKTIGRQAFESCESLAEITIPSRVTMIDYGTFSSCTSLTSVTIQSGLTTIGECAFVGCKSLTSVTMPSSVTTIGEEAFYGCNLLSVSVPSSVVMIGKDAFKGCKSVDRQAKELYRLFGVKFGEKKPKHFTTSSYNVCDIPAYDYIPQKRFLDFDTYTVLYDLNEKVFFIRAKKKCSSDDEMMWLRDKAKVAIERKFDRKMEPCNIVAGAADIHEAYYAIEFNNNKRLQLCTAAGNIVFIVGYDPIVFDQIRETKRQHPEIDDAL